MKVGFEKLDIYHPHSNIWKRKWVIFLWVSALADTQEILGLGNLNRHLQLWHPCFQHSAFIDFFFLMLHLSPFKLTLKSPFFLGRNADPMAPKKCQKLEVLGLDTWRHLSSDQRTEMCSYQLCEDTNLSSLCVIDLKRAQYFMEVSTQVYKFLHIYRRSFVISWQWFLMQILQRLQQAMGEKRKPSSNNQPMTPLRGSPFGKKFRASQVA